jgi:hypothetical protein
MESLKCKLGVARVEGVGGREPRMCTDGRLLSHRLGRLGGFRGWEMGSADCRVQSAKCKVQKGESCRFIGESSCEMVSIIIRQQLGQKVESWRGYFGEIFGSRGERVGG